MPLSRRYSPEWAPGDRGMVGIDMSGIIPGGVGIGSGSLSIQVNTSPPSSSDGDFSVSSLFIIGRLVYATLSGGISGKDYLFTWTISDTDGNIWNRSALMLCAPTS